MNKMLWYLINLPWNLIKYTGLTGLSCSIFSLVDITGLFLFYDITYCLELMNKMRWNLIKIRSGVIFSWFRISSYFNVDKRLRFRLVS